ncbi:MAG: hypothetical protein PHF70_01070 [Opitutales bacterium]|nr:hypothetical protein [Opitutales bacterium]
MKFLTTLLFSQADESDQRTHFRSGLLVLIVCFAYGLGYMVWYGNTPLGLHPALDGSQNLETARLIWSGTYDGGIFQRSPMYSLLLSWMVGLEEITGISTVSWARFLNFASVITTAWMVGLSSFLLWNNHRSLFLGVVLVGFNPVVLFFAGDPLDISMAGCCMAVFLWIYLNAAKMNRFDGKSWFLSGLVLGFGVALRPMFLFLGWVWPLYALITSRVYHRRECSWGCSLFHCFLAGVGVLGSYAFNGWANWKWADEVYFQQRGSGFSVWWGNGPESNGRFYTQGLELEGLQAWENPMIVESELIFAAISGETEPFSEDEMNRYFVREAVRGVWDDPFGWILLMTKKFQSLIHDHEQFDNKTYSFHKNRSPWLSWNPIGWGLITVLGVGGIWILVRRKDESLWFLLMVLMLYSGVILATFTANRYRVPLIPVLAVLSSWVAIPLKGFRLDKRMDWKLPVFLFALSIVVFGPFGGIRGEDSRDADYCLLARACHLSGDDDAALYWADLALKTMPWRSDMQSLRIVSRFNSWFFKQDENPPCEVLRLDLERIDATQRHSPAIEFARAMYLYKLGKITESIRNLAMIADSHPLAHEALAVIHQESTLDSERAAFWNAALRPCPDASAFP